MDILNSMMLEYGLDTPKVRLSGSKEDMDMFIAGLIDYKMNYKIDARLERYMKEFDPDDTNADFNQTLK